MAKKASDRTRRDSPRPPAGGGSPSGVIHPVLIYPYHQPADYAHLSELYGLAGRLNRQRTKYAKPITVMDGKTQAAASADRAFRAFREEEVAAHSDLVVAWCVDTCQMWYTGLGLAFERGRPGDVYWLIPGDFDYGKAAGREVLARLGDLPEIIQELNQDLCVGEIATDHNNPKQLIDTYGTFALLYNWFPAEAREIREYTERPRSEFFAISHDFLGRVLRQRWFAYEQTVVTLLRAVFEGRRISRFFVGQVSDLPEGGESLDSAIQQVERTERVLKTVWRERNRETTGWVERYRGLDLHSEQIRRTAITLFENLLTRAE